MNKFIKALASPILMVVCLVLFAVSMAVATFVEAIHGTNVARETVYAAKWFEFVIIVGSLNLLCSVFTRKLYKKEKFSIFLFHIAFVVIIIGAGFTRYTGFEGTMQIRENEQSNSIIRLDNSTHELPFSLFLNDFIVEYYPGSTNPSGFKSQVTLIDPDKDIWEERSIFMNNILTHRGYRFYQSSYTKDQRGTILSVSKDALGTAVSYAGYVLLALGMVVSLFNPNGRFRNLIKNKSVVVTLLLLVTFTSIHAQSTDSLPVIPKDHAREFGKILVRDYQGRTKPINTLASDILRKVNRSDEFNNQDAMQILIGMLAFPEKWQHVEIVYAGSKVQEALKLNNAYASLYDSYLGQGRFISSNDAYLSYQKIAGERSKTDKAIIKYDERLNITYHWFMGNMLSIFPVQEDSLGSWYNPVTIQGVIDSEDSVFVNSVVPYYLQEVRSAVKTNDWSTANDLVQAIKIYQRKYDKDIPTVRQVELEHWYYRSDVFKKSAYLYLLFGLILLCAQLILIFRNKKDKNILTLILSGGIVGVLLLHTLGLAIRWYISEHAPWSNAYETMIFIGWSSVIAGTFYIKRNPTAFSISAIMASIFLVVANMAWMDPQITNLVPVLKSIWLVIHVAVITSSYGFLGIGGLIAFVNLIIMGVQTRNNRQQSTELIHNLTKIIELTLTIGVYLITIGTFLGAVWANVSWGRYWAWDPKETWALITAIVYATVLHLRLIPKLKNTVLFNILALLSYATVLMTYFGVNFYLSGLHSYAQGDPAPIPSGVYYALGIVFIISVLAIINQRRQASIE